MFRGKEFFQNAFDDNEAKVEQVVIDTPNEATEVKEVATDATKEVKVAQEVKESEMVAPSFDIDGEKITIDQIKEWKQNGLRQSDYTKKTQELAEQRKELLSKAIVPDVEGESESTDSSRIRKLERDLATNKLESEIASLKTKYPDFDEDKVLLEAHKRGIYDDLEFVYKATRDNVGTSINIEEVQSKAIEDYKNEIALKKQTNKEAVEGSTVTSLPGAPAIDYANELTSDERTFAKKRGLTDKEYVDQKNAIYN